jgi:hypothetical protein
VRALPWLLASVVLAAVPGCERSKVSLGDDRPAVAPPDGAPAAGDQDAAPPAEPSAPDAGDDWRPDHHPPLEPPDAGDFDDEPFGCGFCAPGELCTRADDPSCAAQDLPVRCESIEDICPQRAAPVCGCDGQSYGSRCEAVALGVKVRGEGSCQPPESVVQCASFAGASCGPDAYCRFALGAFCGNAGVLGSCEPRTQRCDDEGRVVCGCDGQSYQSACWAAMSGVSIAFLGSCESGGGGGRL